MPTLTKKKNHVEIHLQPSDPYAGVLTREELTPIVMAFLSGAQ